MIWGAQAASLLFSTAGYLFRQCAFVSARDTLCRLPQAAGNPEAFGPGQPEPSAINHRHRPVGITGPCKGLVWRDFIDAREILAGKSNIERSDIFLQIFAPFRAGNRDDVVALRENPGKGQLRRRALFLVRDFFDAFHEIQIALKIFALKSRCRAPVIVLWQILWLLNLSSEKPAAERTVRHEADAKLAADAKNFGFGVARPERVFRLQRSDRMNGVR